MTGKEIRWIGSSFSDLKAFPREVLKEVGYQLSQIQAGLEPVDWKPFTEVGPGTQEIRLRDRTGIYRVMYVAKFEEAVYVLHCFQKKTQTTSQQDKEIAANRYKSVLRERKAKP